MDVLALHFFWVLVAVIAAPLSPFSRVAAVVVVARVVNQTTWWVVPDWEPLAQAIVFSVACAAAFRWAERAACVAVACLLCVQSIASLAWSAHAVDPVIAWWAILIAGIAQISILPFCADWQAIKTGVEGLRDMSWINRLLRVEWA